LKNEKIKYRGLTLFLAELAYRLITQPAFPGWVHWLRQGATTLLESWDDINSRNHILFGDISAWFIQYLGGLQPDPAHPGFKRVLFRPHFPQNLNHAQATHHSPHGPIRSAWKHEGETLQVTLELPDGVEADWKTPPSGTPYTGITGLKHFVFPVAGIPS